MILLTGSEGYIAHQLDFGSRKVVKLDTSPGADIPLCYSKISQKRDLLEEVEVVVHTADLRLEDYTEKEVEQTQQKATQFFEALSNAPRLKKVVLTSSCSVYGHQEGEITEESITKATSFYAESKLNVEKALRSSSLPYAILRFGTAYGLNRKTREDLLVNQLLISLKNRNQMELRGLEAYRPYVHCKDFALALQTFALDERLGLYNIVESNWTKKQILEILKEALLTVEDYLTLRTDLPDPRHYFVKAQEHFECRYNLKSYLQEQLA